MDRRHVAAALGLAFVVLAAPTFVLGQAGAPAAGDDIEEIEEIETVEDVVVAPAAGGAARELGVLEIVGRMHPALVHLPIAWLILLLLVDLAGVALGREPFRAVGIWLAGLLVLSFIPAAAAGLIRATFPPYTAQTEGLVFLHRNLMLTVAGLTVAAFVLRLVRRNRLAGALQWAYLALLVAAVGLVTVAGHIGAKLVFGEDYLPF